MNDYLQDLKAGGRPMTKKEIKIKELQTKINKSIEYIEERFDGEVFTHTFDKCNMRELLEILGEKENE